MSKNESLVRTHKHDSGVVTIELNDPDSRNAMSAEMGERFVEVIAELQNDTTARVVVLQGAGTAFSGGGHLDMLAEKINIPADENQRLMELFYEQFLSILKLEVPTIAAINGHAIGAGMCIALACDIRIVKKNAKLGLNFVHLGLHPGMGATYFLPRIVGPAKAAELLYGGKIITAEEAETFGLINRCVNEEEFDGVVEDMANLIAKAGPQSIGELKESLQGSMTRTLAECLRREAECQARDYAGKEFAEGVQAAKEKRKPSFG